MEGLGFSWNVISDKGETGIILGRKVFLLKEMRYHSWVLWVVTYMLVEMVIVVELMSLAE